VAKAKRLLGYDPSVTIDSGLTRFVQWYRQQEQTTQQDNQ
jgi:nucleoside-diphosphate-sugar epimerase